ncbi:MAG: 4-hydroxy-tetrahydrodipicolinate reductase [Methermicoccaceae archaeon]
MLKVAISGVMGRMGSLIAKLVTDADDMELVLPLDVVGVGELVGTVPVEDGKRIVSALETHDVDVLIDFTMPAATITSAKAAAKKGVALVIGTTGFTEKELERLKESVGELTPCILSPNFSIGVNAFIRIAGEAAKLLGGYDIEIIEAHHRLKKDAPSGTAKKILDDLMEISEIQRAVYGREGVSPRENEIGVHAIRGGDIVGDHTVLFAGDGDRIEIKHQAHSRLTFAKGAIEATRWIVKQKPGMHTMNEFLTDFYQRR